MKKVSIIFLALTLLLFCKIANAASTAPKSFWESDDMTWFACCIGILGAAIIIRINNKRRAKKPLVFDQDLIKKEDIKVESKDDFYTPYKPTGEVEG